MKSDIDDKKNKIYQSACKLFLHYGVNKTTISDIARDADIGKGTIYSYFESKDDILKYIGFEYFKESLERLKTALQELKEPEHKLREIVLLKPLEVYRFIHTYTHGADILLYINKAEIEKSGYSDHFKTYCDLFSSVVDQLTKSGEYNVSDKQQFIEHYKFMSRAFMPPYSEIIDSEEALKSQINSYVDMMLRSMQQS